MKKHRRELENPSTSTLERNTMIVNLVGAPASGKSLVMADLYQKIKRQGYSVEMAQEYAKELVWAKNYEALGDQRAIFKEQLRRIQVLNGKVDLILTDSPLLLSLVYTDVGDQIMTEEEKEIFYAEVIAHHNSFHNMNFYLDRIGDIPYEQMGRVDNEEQSNQIAVSMQKMLNDVQVEYFKVNSLQTDMMSRIILNRFDNSH